MEFDCQIIIIFGDFLRLCSFHKMKKGRMVFVMQNNGFKKKI